MPEKKQQENIEKNKEKFQEIGYVKPREIVTEMQEDYLDYAMSVIVSRALPDVRDGLKPVHRRILFAMNEMGLRHNVKFRKSATVVGEVLGKFHPHGDVAVYDSLVRMAQDFSLRYPLIKGQGNFGCFTKETKVRLTDGRDLSFEDLVKEYSEGKKNYTYTINKLGLISMAEIQNPRLTKKNTELVEVGLDNGEKIKCTPNHLFMLRDGSYREVQSLSAGESLMPLYQKISEKIDRLNREGYVLIFQNKKEEWVPAHHLADNYNLTNHSYVKNRGKVRHHLNFNKLNNNPGNIVRMQWGEHWQEHYKHASLQHQNEGYRQKIAEGRKKYFDNPETRVKYSKLISERNKKNWQDLAYREKMKLFLSEVNKDYIQKHPEKRKELSERATKTLKRLWQNPEYRFWMHEKIIKGNKNHKTNQTGKKKFLNVCREVLNDKFILNEENYNSARNRVYAYGASTSWGKGLAKYFSSDLNLVLKEINNNHRVLYVKNLVEKEDVYDLTIENSHNFCLSAGVFVHNSIDGDSAASMRYTECRLSMIGEETLRDIEKDTVDFTPNYDTTRKEPKVLPSPMPQLLLNGSLGIAVGMATNIPPHNVTEVLQATIYLIDHPQATTEDLFQFVKGPDFPTGGIIYGKKEIITAYSQGKGPILVRGKADIEETKKGFSQIIITEIPYQVSKSTLVQQFAKLVETKRVEGIKDIRDESDREGMRIAIDLKKEAFPKKILNALFKYTDLQRTFHLNLLALVDGIQPRILSLVDVLTFYLKHKEEVVVRRIKFDLQRAKERAHILEGLMIALDNIDEVIKTIKQSDGREDASINLQKKFKLTEVQAIAILEMRLQNLAKLERAKIENELAELQKRIKEWEMILKSQAKIKEVMKKELQEMEEKYKDIRKTKLMVGKIGEIGDEDLIPQEEAIITVTQGGFVKRQKPSVYKIQQRGGKGVSGLEVNDEDIVEHFAFVNTLDKLMFFTDSGKMFQCFAWEIAEMSKGSKGRGLLNFIDISGQDKVQNLLSYTKQDELSTDKYLVMITKYGIIKKTELPAFKNVRRNGLLAIKLQTGDSLRSAKIADKGDEISLVTRDGKSIRFKESDVRPMGRGASGVKAIKLSQRDEVVGMDIIKCQMLDVKSQNLQNLLIITENGYGKRTKLEEYRLQKRGGTGIKASKVNEKTGKIVFVRVLEGEQDLIAISKKGQVIRSSLNSVSIIGRASAGVRVMKLAKDDKVASAICL